MKKRKLSFTSVGGSSILTIFAVLCFLVFALLSLSTAKANYNLAEKSVKAVSNYYAADTKAEEIYSQIRAGNMPDCGMTVAGTTTNVSAVGMEMYGDLSMNNLSDAAVREQLGKD